MIIYSLDILLSQFWTSPLPMSISNYSFLTLKHISQETGKMIWYSHFFKNFPQSVVSHTVKNFSVVNEVKLDVLLKLPFFLHDPTNVGYLISGVSASSNISLYIGKVSFHALLKPSLKGFEHNLVRMWNEHICNVFWIFLGIVLLWDCNKNWLFPVLWPLLSFSK